MHPPVLAQAHTDIPCVRVRDNPRGGRPIEDGPDNQQERLVDPSWVTGFVDGEGCFSIGFVRQPNRTSRRGYKTGYQVAHSFVVVQGAKSVSCLDELKSFFGIGGVSINRRHDNHKEDLYRYSVSRRDDLSRVIVP